MVNTVLKWQQGTASFILGEYMKNLFLLYLLELQRPENTSVKDSGTMGD